MLVVVVMVGRRRGGEAGPRHLLQSMSLASVARGQVAQATTTIRFIASFYPTIAVAIVINSIPPIYISLALRAKKQCTTASDSSQPEDPVPLATSPRILPTSAYGTIPTPSDPPLLPIPTTSAAVEEETMTERNIVSLIRPS
jgi:hypothetical protein